MSLQNKKYKLSGYALTFIYCALTAFVFFIPFLIIDKGFFLFAGDFNSQQIPFYTYVNDFVKTQSGQYSWHSDLGGSIINTYSFYLLGSPFFWLSALFPASWAAYMMVPMLIFKFGVMGVGAYAYLKRYTNNMQIAIAGACLYAFCGFNIYNIFFNHFVDCAVLFPFMLAALDSFVIDKKKAFFAFCVAINLLNNYFFFAGQIIFLFIYFIVKVITKEYKISVKEFLTLAFESLLGVAMGCLFLLPAALSLQNNPRTVNVASGFGMIMYYSVQQYFAIFTSIFMPPDPAYIPSIYTEGVIKWTSMSAFLPIVSASGAIAFMAKRKKRAFSIILSACFIMAMVPILNSAFYMFNSSYYARWFYMPILIMCAVTMPVLQDAIKPKKFRVYDLKGAILKTMLFTGLIAIFGLVPTEIDGVWQIGTANKPQQFWLLWAMAMLALLLFYAAAHFKMGKKSFINLVLVLILSYSAVYSATHIALGKFPQINGDKDYRQDTYISAAQINWPQSEQFYRTDSYEAQDNIGLWAKTSNLQFFNSVVTPSIMEFYPSVDVKRDVSSKPEHDKYALRGLLGVKYIMVPNEKTQTFDEEVADYGYEFAFESGSYNIYENTNYYGMGFAYDKYIEHDAFDDLNDSIKPNILVRALVLSEEQIIKYGNIITQVSDADKQNIDYDNYVKDMQKLGDNAVQNFEASSEGFSCDITLNKASLVFFAVPFEEGFSAQVNGQEVEIENVSNGMMAIKCEEGYNDIVFNYETQGFSTSLSITIAALIIFALYVLLNMLYSKRKAKSVQLISKGKE